MREERKKSSLSDDGMGTDGKKDPTAYMDTHGFVTVLYGEYQQAIFNNWCMGSVLMDCIRKTCKCEDEDELDLADLRGTVKKLPEHRADYAHTVIPQRETYVLVKIQNGEEPDRKVYTSLLDDPENRYPEIAERLNQHLASNTVSTQGKKRWGMMRTVSKISGSIAKKATQSNNHGGHGGHGGQRRSSTKR